MSIYTPGDTSIYLGTDGDLIFPYQDSTDGQWIYHWDKNENGVADDSVTMGSLNSLLSYNSAMTTLSGDVDSTNRFGAVGQVEVAMAELGANIGATHAIPNGFYWAPTDAGLTDLAKIYAPYTSQNTSWLWYEGHPTNWGMQYWTATEATVAMNGVTVGENYLMGHLTVLGTASAASQTESTMGANVALWVI